MKNGNRLHRGMVVAPSFKVRLDQALRAIKGLHLLSAAPIAQCGHSRVPTVCPQADPWKRRALEKEKDGSSIGQAAGWHLLARYVSQKSESCMRFHRISQIGRNPWSPNPLGRLSWILHFRAMGEGGGPMLTDGSFF